VTITAIQTDNSPIVLKLENVFHMPSLTVNLLSGPTIMEKGLYIDGLTHTIRLEYDKSKICKFQLLRKAIRICTVVPAKTDQPSHALTAAAQSIEVWHRHLGHISLENVRKTAQITEGIEIGPKLTKPACKPCILSKAVRTQSKEPQQRCEHAFNKLHVDLLGLITPTGLDGSNWAMIKTDDASRARWLSTFRKKGDAKISIQDFITAIHT